MRIKLFNLIRLSPLELRSITHNLLIIIINIQTLIFMLKTLKIKIRGKLDFFDLDNTKIKQILIRIFCVLISNFK